MQEPNLRERNNDKPKVPLQKPAIAAKPKYVPPVKLKSQPLPKRDAPQQQQTARDYGVAKETPKEVLHSEKKVEYTETYSTNVFQPYTLHPHLPPPPEAFKNCAYVEYTTKYEEYTKCTEKCDKFTTKPKIVEGPIAKAPNSPSTVCCSILSNASNDCCGIIANPNKKELNGKTITKIDSVDSNSSDSGGFKDFVQLDLTQKSSDEKREQTQAISQQRVTSQTEFSSQTTRQSTAPPKQNYIPNAQALAQFLPQEQNTYKPFSLDRTDASSRQPIGKLNVAQASQKFLEKAEERKPFQKTRPQIISQTQFQQSTKKIEELLSQRYEKEKVTRKGQSCLLDGESSQDVEQKMLVQKQIQQKLQADLQQTVKQIQEIQSIELRLPQNRKFNEVGCVMFCI